MYFSKLALFLLIFTLIAAPALRVSGISAKKTLSKDEGFSYVCATGHATEYVRATEGRYPFGEWVLAAEWKKFLQLDQRFCFKKIGLDLASTDIHPPLYFWLLHVWSLVFGINLWTGPSLNLVLSLLAILALYVLARDLLRNSIEAAVVACAWAFSPAVFQISFEARQYDLLALLTILFVWRLVRYSDLKINPRPGDFFLVTALTAAGALTYYYFALIVAGGGIFAIFRLGRANRKRLLQIFGALICGYAIFFLLHPHFYRSFMNESLMRGDFSSENLITRVENIFASFRFFFMNPLAIKPLGYILFAALTIWLIIALRRQGLKLFHDIRRADFSGLQILFFFFWIAGIQIVLYLTYVSPSHAMNPKYLSMAWPFFAFMPILILRLFRSHLAPLAILFCIAIAISGIHGLRGFNDFTANQPDPTATLAKARAIVVDNVSMGYLPRVLCKAADEQMVFAMHPADILSRKELWLNRLDSTTIMIRFDDPNSRRDGLYDGAQKLRAILDETVESEWMAGNAWGLGDVIKIRRKMANSL